MKQDKEIEGEGKQKRVKMEESKAGTIFFFLCAIVATHHVATMA